MNTKKFSLVLLSVIMVLSLCAFAACNRDSAYKAGDEVGEYYCVVNGAEATLTLTNEGQATLALGKETLNGLCEKDKDNANVLTVTFDNPEGETAKATYGNDVIVLSFRNNEYRFLRNVNYTVTFNSNGGSAVAAQQVRNGKMATKPADPTNGDKVFLGWYKDNETFKDAYRFGAETVTGNITLYACYGESASGEFTVTYDPCYEGGETSTAKTVDGVAKNLEAPAREGYKFVGWYVSDFDDAAKLTYKYEGQTLYQNTVLYGVWDSDVPVVSVYGNKITWTNEGTGTYNVYVYGANDKLLASTQTQSFEYDFDFSAQKAGEYNVRVSYRGKSGNAYLKNKALAKVSLFDVYNGTVLSFKAVPNAEEYVLKIECGNKNHKHDALSIGSSTVYDFANCDMQKGGIKFTVTAKADGYLSSVSAEYVFEQGLDQVTGLKATDDGKLTWNEVKNAQYYLVTVKVGEGEPTSVPVKTNEMSLKEYGVGAMTFTVKPVADNYYSPEATELTYQKVTLASPKNITLNNNTLTWDAVEGATYNVKIGANVYKTNTNSLVLQQSYFTDSDRTVSVQAIVGTSMSLYSDPSAVTSKLTEDIVSYANGVVTWGNVFGAVGYRVEVNPGETASLDSDVHSYALNITSSGEYTIRVSAFGEGITGSVTIDVSIYSLYFESNGGTVVSTEYVAKGDYLVLPESAKGGYEFEGWYNTIGGAETNGKKYADGQFDYSSDVTMYASWTPKPIKVTMKWQDGDQTLTDTATVYYEQPFTLPMPPESEPNGYVFGGWYLGSIKYTDQNGKSLLSFDRIDDVTLEATYVEVLKFELLNDGTGYAVKKGDYINLVSEVTIPATYKGLPVLSIKPEAFSSCSKLLVLNIPDTVNDMFISVDGLTATGSSFESTNYLQALNVYETEVESPSKGRYFSDDGVLYRYVDDTTKELYAYPTEKKGDYAILDGVQEIRGNAFKSAKMSSITIPASVTYIEEKAFASNSNLTNVIFAEPAEDEEVKDVEVEDSAFYLCSNLLEVTLPTRMQTLNRNMFRSCSNLSSVWFTSDSGKYRSLDGVVISAEEDGTQTLVWYPVGRSGNYSIPNGITKIDDFAFTTRFENSATSTAPYTYYGNKNIEVITIPAYVTYIGENAFRSCTNIKQINFLGKASDNALTIKDNAFYGITNSEFVEVTLPENLTYLGVSAFGYCTYLVTVNLNSVNCADFQTGAFGYNTAGIVSNFTYYVTTLNIGKNTGAIEISGVFGIKLAEVEVDPDNPNYAVLDNVVYDKAIVSVLFYPAEKQGAYTTPETVTNIGANVFRDRNGLTGVTIGKNVKTIGDNAFVGCKSLKYVEFEAGGTEDLVLGEAVFKNCSILTEIALPERTVEVGSELFASCFDLVTVYLPSTLVTVKYGYDSTLKMDIFNMFPATSSADISEIVVAEANPKYASYNGLLYEKNEDGALATLVYCPSGKTGTIDAPKTVTYIAPKAFAYSHATKLMFSEGIEEGATLVFGQSVFYNSELTEIELPKGLTEIADKMFYWNEELVKVTVPDTVTRIGKEAFYYCKALESVVIPDSVTVIDEKAFYTCSSLTSVTIPNSVETIGKMAFSSCSKLTSLTFKEGSEKDAEGNYIHPLTIANADISSGSSEGSWYYGVFYNTKIEELRFPERTKEIGSYLMGYYSGGSGGSATNNNTLKSVSIPSTIDTIGKGAFYYCKALETVEFVGDGVSTLKDGKKISSYDNGAALDNTFYGCTALREVKNLPESSTEEGYSLYYTFSMGYSGVKTNLTTLEIPASVKSVEYAFNNNSGLETLTFRKGSKLEIVKSSFDGCKILDNLALPEGLKTIGYNAFKGLLSLQSITIPATVQTIGYQAFANCTSLATINFATYAEGENKGMCSIESIGYQAFSYTAISEFAFPVSVKNSIALNLDGSTTSKGRLFKGCKNLTAVTLSKSVTDIEYVLEDCASIDNIIIADDNDSFTTKEGQPYIYNKTGEEILLLYGAAPKGHVVIPEDTTAIAAYVYKAHVGITEVTIPYTVGRIGSGAFDSCLGLTKVNFQNTPDKPSALQTIGESAFANCINLTEVVLPDTEGFDTISKYMFMRSGFTSIKIPASVKTISDYAFAGCYDLTKVEFAEDGKLTLIDGYSFQHTALEELTIPHSVVTIDAYAFQYVPTLTKVTFAKDANGNSSLASIYGSTFGGAEAGANQLIESVVIPKSVTNLYASSFSNMKNLKTVTFEEGSKLTKMTSAFAGSAITSITIPANVVTIDKDAFKDCADLTTVTIEEGSKLTTINANAFLNCKNLTSINLEAATKLTKINANAFQHCSSLTSIKIPQPVTNVEKLAFGDCTSLEKIEFLGTSLKTLGVQVFQSCTSLTSVNLPTGALTTIPNYAFYDCSSLVSIDIPDSVTTINQYVFSGCTALENVNFGAGSKLNKFGTYVFSNYNGSTSISNPMPAVDAATSLKTIAIPDLVVALGNYMFQNCSALEEVTFGENSKLNFLGTNTFLNSGLIRIEVPKGVTKLGTSATACKIGSSVNVFRECDRLESVTFKGKLTAIGGYAFFSCDSLYMDIPETVTLLGVNAFAYSPATSYTIPKGLTAANIGNAPFGYCQNLTSITVADGNTSVMVDETSGALVSMTGEVICYPAGLKGDNGVVTIPDNMGITIRAYAFMGCSDIKVVLPSDMTGLPNYAFALSCVTEVTLPEGLTAIGNYAFQNCRSLETITLPETLTYIGNNAFSGSGLKSITIPGSVKQFTTSATAKYTLSASTPIFQDCTSLKEVTFGEGFTSIGAKTFKGCTSLTTVNFPSTLTDIGNYAFSGSGLESMVIPNSVTAFGTYMFQNCLNLVSVTLPDGITEIPNYTFDGATALETVVIPQGVTAIGTGTSSTYVFRNTTSLKDVVLPEGVTSITNYAFQNSGIQSITLPSTLTTIGTYVFQNAINLKSVTFPEALTSIGNYAFSGSGLESVTVPASVTTLGTYVFKGCESLASVTIEEGVTKLSNYTFAGCTALESVVIPDSVTTLGTYMFDGCSSLKNVTLSNNLTVLPMYIFQNCTSLESFVVPEGVTELSTAVFRGCTALTKVVLPESLTNIGNNAFNDCTSLSEITIPENVTKVNFNAFNNCTSIKKIIFRQPPENVGNGAFDGWTKDQTICFCFYGTVSKGWALNTSKIDGVWFYNCDANIIWDYVEA